MPDPKPRRAYHHGDARNALLAAAHELLPTVGAAGLSLRQVAEHAGLSRQAPYNHFADKEALLAALVVQGFERLRVRMERLVADLAGEPAVRAAGEAYMGFALDEPTLFRLMFARELVDLAKFPGYAATAAESYAVLTRVIAGVALPGKAETLTLAAWCFVHGYATLCIERKVEPPGMMRERARLFATMVMASAERI